MSKYRVVKVISTYDGEPYWNVEKRYWFLFIPFWGAVVWVNFHSEEAAWNYVKHVSTPPTYSYKEPQG